MFVKQFATRGSLDTRLTAYTGVYDEFSDFSVPVVREDGTEQNNFKVSLSTIPTSSLT